MESRRESSELESEFFYINCRTRHLYSAIKYFEYKKDEKGEKILYENINEETVELIRVQRYTKQYKDKIFKPSVSFYSQSDMPIDQKVKTKNQHPFFF